MIVRVKKWGNSYALRLPSRIVEAMNLAEESPLEMSEEEGVIVLRQEEKRVRLQRLLLEAEPQEEIDWGEPVGKEYW